MHAFYYEFRLWDRVFHTAISIAYCVLVYLQIQYVTRTGRTQHVIWLWPAAIANGLVLIYNVFWDVHYFLGTNVPTEGYLRLGIWLEIANIFGIASGVTMTRMMLADGIFGPVRASKTVDPDSWPPPPSYADTD